MLNYHPRRCLCRIPWKPQKNNLAQLRLHLLQRARH
jgi:hypothetical protein